MILLIMMVGNVLVVGDVMVVAGVLAVGSGVAGFQGDKSPIMQIECTQFIFVSLFWQEIPSHRYKYWLDSNG